MVDIRPIALFSGRFPKNTVAFEQIDWSEFSAI